MVKISVVMPIYNTPVSFLKEAVESILNQTVQDFEFIIVDDGSANEIKEYLEGLTDPRIRIIRNETNIGITKSLNIGFKAAHGQYIARMDSDDISLPERFEKQLAFMEAHPDVIVCGANVENFGSVSFTFPQRISDMETYRIRMVFSNPGPLHPTAFFNRALLERYQIKYDEKLVYAQDYGLWVEIAKHGKICILPEILLKYRRHSQQISAEKREKQIQCDLMIKRRLLMELLGKVTEAELALHFRSSAMLNATISKETIEWFERLMAANAERQVYDRRKFNRYVYYTVYGRLIWNSLPKDATRFQKAKAFFQYLPFPDATRKVTEMCLWKVRQYLHLN